MTDLNEARHELLIQLKLVLLVKVFEEWLSGVFMAAETEEEG